MSQDLGDFDIEAKLIAQEREIKSLKKQLRNTEILLDKKSRCPCGSIILADTEDLKIPMCHSCWGTHNTQKELLKDGRKVIEAALQIKNLWLYGEDLIAKHLDEATAILAMKKNFDDYLEETKWYK